MVPPVIYASSRRVMGELADSRLTIVAAVAIAVVITVLNGNLGYA